MKIAKKCLNFWSSELGLTLRFRRWRHNIRWCHDHYARDFSTEALNESNPNLDLCHLAEQWASITMESAVVWHQMAHRRIWERHNYECYFRVCLVGGEIGGMKRTKKKRGGKMRKSVVWYIRDRESNFSGGSRYFLRKLTQNLSFQNGKKTGWSEFDGEMTKLRMCNAHGQSPVGLFFFFFLIVSKAWTLPPLFFFFILIY